jgi:hypothetical protein
MRTPELRHPPKWWRETTLFVSPERTGDPDKPFVVSQ